MIAVGIQGVERRLERLVEGTFGRLFTSGLKPVELARRLTRELDAGRSVGVNGEVVVPNHFTVALSTADHERFAEVSEVLQRDLCQAVREHARNEGYGFLGPIAVELIVDDGFRTGRFEIDARMRQPERGALTGALLLATGEQIVLGEYVVTIGRLPECTITLGDPNASRNHAEIRPHGTGFVLRDLGSTNGTKVNGVRITEHQLVDGDEVTFGATRITFLAS